MSARPGPVLRYPGAKWRLADWIAGHFPPHDVYVEPFGGSAAVLVGKAPCRAETYNDLDGRVVNFFRVLRDRPGDLAAALALTPFARGEFEASYEPAGDPVEDARRFAVRVWMAHAGKLGTRAGWRHDMGGGRRHGSMPREWDALPERIWPVAARLKAVHIECRPALDVIGASAPGALIYADPPYVHRSLYERSTRYYAHEMTDAEHAALLEALDAHAGPVVLSGYRSDLYDARLGGWRRIDRPTIAYRGAGRVESLWLNAEASAARAERQPALLAAG